MPRLFTALEIPADVAARLAMVRGGLPGARWIEPADFHITLRFIGDVDAATARDTHAVLELIDRPSFTVTLGGLSAFGGAKPRAVVASVMASSSLVDLQAEQEWLLQRVSLAPEPRKYAPHVTLARLRRVPPRAVADFLSLNGFLPMPPFPVARFVLMSARDSVGGGPYRVEAAYPLR